MEKLRLKFVKKRARIENPGGAPEIGAKNGSRAESENTKAAPSTYLDVINFIISAKDYLRKFL